MPPCPIPVPTLGVSVCTGVTEVRSSSIHLAIERLHESFVALACGTVCMYPLWLLAHLNSRTSSLAPVDGRRVCSWDSELWESPQRSFADSACVDKLRRIDTTHPSPVPLSQCLLLCTGCCETNRSPNFPARPPLWFLFQLWSVNRSMLSQVTRSQVMILRSQLKNNGADSMCSYHWLCSNNNRGTPIIQW